MADRPEPTTKGGTRRISEDDAGRPLKKTKIIDGETGEDRSRKNYAMRRRLRTILGLVGFLVLIVGGWIVYTFVAKGKIVDLTSEKGRQEALGSLKEDADQVAETSKPYIEEAATKAKEYYEYSLEDLKKRIKGKPPETKEEITALVKESQQETAHEPSPWEKTSAPVDSAKTAEPAKSGPETGSGAPRVTNLPKSEDPYSHAGKATSDGMLGIQAYGKTDPMSSQENVQVHVRIAKRFFERCLREIDMARAEGKGSPALDALEEKVTKRLYDCNRRLEIQPEYDRKAELEIKKWPW